MIVGEWARCGLLLQEIISGIPSTLCCTQVLLGPVLNMFYLCCLTLRLS